MQRHQYTCEANPNPRPEEKFPCPNCDKVYTRRHTLSRHILDKHVNEEADPVGFDDSAAKGDADDGADPKEDEPAPGDQDPA